MIIGKMTNTPNNPHSDSKANGMIIRNLKMGNKSFLKIL